MIEWWGVDALPVRFLSKYPRWRPFGFGLSDVRPDNVIQGGQGYGLGRPAKQIPQRHAALLPDSPHAQPPLGAAR